MTRKSGRGLAMIACFLAFTAIELGAQRPARELTLDARPFEVSALLGWRAGARAYAGLGLGAGIEEFGKTFNPDPASTDFHKLEQLLHVDAFVRLKPSNHADIDLGARAGIGDLRNCQSSDCLPGGYLAAHTGVFVGGRRWKTGPRIVFARVSDGQYKDWATHLEYVLVRYTVAW